MSLKYTYKYGDNGNQIEQNLFNPDGSLSLKHTYKYDDNGNQTESNDYNSDGNLSLKYIYKYEYDKAGNWIKKTSIRNNKPDSITERVIEYF